MKPIEELAQLNNEIVSSLLSIVHAKKTFFAISVIHRDGTAKSCEMDNIDDSLALGHTIKCRLNHTDAIWNSLWLQCSAIVGRKISINSLSCFISPTGGHTPLHFDKNSVLVIQLAGIKHVGVQRVATNTTPNDDFLVEDQSTPLDLWHTLNAGELVYIPAGHIHTTATDVLSTTLGVGFELLTDVTQCVD